MRLLTSLLYKVTLSSMILTAPAMISGHSSSESYRSSINNTMRAGASFSANVIKRFVNRPTVIAMRAYPLAGSAESRIVELHPTEIADRPTEIAVAKPLEEARADKPVAATVATRTATANAAEAKAAEVRMVVRHASLIYTAMELQDAGLDSKAFEYAWRGYHNLVKKGLIPRRSILSICDFSQSSRSRRMYVIDVEHKRLLYRTYVAHGQNSGDEFASNFSNADDSYMSSLGFYITRRTYVGRNGLSLRLDGVDPGYNDNARRRMIVLHGSAYAGERYMQDYGNLGTSLGCPALPAEISGRIIRTVKGGSVLFIYHPTQQYLDNSTVLHG